jgi:putative transposase
MKIQKSFKIRIYLTKVQEAMLAKVFGCKRFMWNQMLGERIAYYHEHGKGIGKFRRTEKEWKILFPFLKAVDSIALQQARIDLDTAYKNFFVERARFPRFKSRKDNQSYRTEYVSGNIRIDMQRLRIKLPRLGWFSYRDDRVITGTIKNATVSKTKSGRYFASVLVSQEIEIEQKATLNEGSIAAFDMSAKEFLVGDIMKYENPRFYRNNEVKLARLGRRVSRKVKGSANRNKARVQLARLYDRIGNQRTDWMQKMSTDLANHHDAIVIEDLNIDGMKRWNGGFAKSVTLDFS